MYGFARATSAVVGLHRASGWHMQEDAADEICAAADAKVPQSTKQSKLPDY